jgi:hypothetical protein
MWARRREDVRIDTISTRPPCLKPNNQKKKNEKKKTNDNREKSELLARAKKPSYNTPHNNRYMTYIKRDTHHTLTSYCIPYTIYKLSFKNQKVATVYRIEMNLYIVFNNTFFPPRARVSLSSSSSKIHLQR